MVDIWTFENCSNEFIEKEKIYTKLLLEYTKTHNVTALKNEFDVVKNIKDSIYPVQFIKDAKSVADIGSGAGFPAIHLALLFDKIEFTLYEPIKKKSAFLHLAKAKLGLKNVQIASKRAEQEKDKKYDLITSRAVTKVEMLLKICENLLHEKSNLLLYKGSSINDELPKKLNYEILKKNERNYVYIKDIF